MSGEINSGLRFIDYVVNDIEYRANQNFIDQDVTVKFNVFRDVEYLEDENNTILVSLIISIFEDAAENNYPFYLKINMTGIFELDHIHVESREGFAEVNAVAILFPYIRALISTITANVNVPPLILPPINVVNLIEEQKKKNN